MTSPPACPGCGSPRHEAHGKRLAVYPYALLAIFGIMFGSLHQAAQPYQYTCRDCGRHFRRRSTSARVALVILGLSIAILLSGIILSLMVL